MDKSRIILLDGLTSTILYFLYEVCLGRRYCFIIECRLINLFQFLLYTSIMIESPIRRKNIYYPKDFLPSNPRPATHNKKFSFNDGYQIDSDVIKKYSQSIEQEKKPDEKASTAVTTVPNPEKITLAAQELTEDEPLGQHAFGKKPDINADVLKRPRFSMKHNEEIPENNEQALQASTSPGGIRKQLADRQTPLPLQDPCRIELLQPTNNKITKIPDSYIKYRVGGSTEGKTWRSSQKEILEKFQESRMKRSMNELPVVNKHALNQSFNASAAKDVYDSFRRRQNSTAANFGKINTFLMSLKKEDGKLADTSMPIIPRFQPSSAIQKLKEDINLITKARKRGNADKKQEPVEDNNEESSEQSFEQRQPSQNIQKRKPKPPKTAFAPKIPQYLVSYRSSLSYLKDLYAQTSGLDEFKLTVKIPKLFTQQIIHKNQQKSQLYDTARSIFTQLRIPCENLVIKRYTNCTMIISRNICLIWHFDGKRYLGGWQTEYLDEGCKHGLGLEWEPKNYVYYGEFAKNKREGLGAFKDRNNIVYVGYWKKGKKYEQNDREDEEQYDRYSQENEEEDPYQDAYYEYL